jgi:Putative zinc-finger
VTHSGDHILDETLSALVDNQLGPDAAQSARVHLAACSECQQRLDELRSVVALLRALPVVEPPRDFRLGPRLVVAPPNVVRLRRWYTAARASAASLAAVFVVLSAGALYVDTRPAAVPATPEARQQVVSAPAAAGQSAPTAAPRLAAPAPAAARRAEPTAQGAESDQVAAATSVRPLPTPVPTPVPTPLPQPPPQPVSSARLDSAAPLRTGAAIVGVLAALTLVATLAVRHRLTTASSTKF